MASRFVLEVRLACATLSWTGTATISPGSVASGKLVCQPAVLDEPANELQASEISRRLIHWICDVHLPKMIQAANFQVRETALAQGLKPLLCPCSQFHLGVVRRSFFAVLLVFFQAWLMCLVSKL